MTEQISDFDEKLKRRRRQSPIDFVIPLQLEECLHRLHENWSIQQNLTVMKQPSNDPGERKLDILYRENQRFQAEAYLTAQRWQGTHTRFKGTAQTAAIHPRFASLRQDLDWFYSIVILLSVLVSLFLGIAFPEPLDAFLLFALIFIAAIVYVVSVYILKSISHRLYRQKFIKVMHMYLMADKLSSQYDS